MCVSARAVRTPLRTSCVHQVPVVPRPTREYGARKVAIRLDILRAHDAPATPAALLREVAQAANVPLQAVKRAQIVKQALDARRQMRVPTWVLTVDAELEVEPGSTGGRANLRAVPPPTPRLASPKAPVDGPPIAVVGAGPAGLFAAWHLSEMGAKVHLFERGKPVETRARDFGRFRGKGILDPESNICFGEGGAGTYSDGKLTCRTSDPLVREVLERFVECGAPERILVDAKPHIGTNLLFRVLKGIRQRLLENGAELHYQTRVEQVRTEGGRLVGLELADGSIFGTPRALFAIGHSARDTYEKLLSAGVPMEPKPFAVGVRAEHPQALIDAAQYRLRGARPDTLPPADYRLAHQEGTRGVYSFCMCPGGMIVPTATELDTVVVNGMSTARRSTPFANSGVVVQVELADLEREGCGTGPLAGLEFQRRLERAAFAAGGQSYRAPAMLAQDFVRKKASGRLADSHFRPGLVAADLREVLPAFVAQGLAAGLLRFDQQLRGYTSAEANLIAVESRTSSPLRIPRHADTREVPGFAGLHVAGEGPGYAGGIMSAAIDGLRTAHAILAALSSL